MALRSVLQTVFCLILTGAEAAAPPDPTVPQDDCFVPGIPAKVIAMPQQWLGQNEDSGSAKVTFRDGNHNGDELRLSQAIQDQYGVTASYDAAKGVLSITGDNQVDIYAIIINNVEMVTLDPAGFRRISWNLGGNGHDALFDMDSGHFYEFIEQTVTWDQAYTACQNLDLFGYTGYLATITSDAENDFAAQKVSGNGWIGSSDRHTEGDWRWVTGCEGEEDPPLGRLYWRGTDKGTNNGQAIGNEYNNWLDGEPNNHLLREDHGHMYSGPGARAGFWNDFWTGDISIQGYICEWGGSCPSAGTALFNPAGQTNVSMCPPTSDPTNVPSASPTVTDPTHSPSSSPTTPQPTYPPSGGPTGSLPSGAPTASLPSGAPTASLPSGAPTTPPTATPIVSPTTPPTRSPSVHPPTRSPSVHPTGVPTGSPFIVCTPQDDCNNHAVSARVNARNTGCVCVCRNQWSGPVCDTCREQYNVLSDCAVCAEGYIEYPTCAASARPTAAPSSSPTPPPDCDDDTSHLLVHIILAGAVIFAFLMLLLVAFCRRKQRRRLARGDAAGRDSRQSIELPLNDEPQIVQDRTVVVYTSSSNKEYQTNAVCNKDNTPIWTSATSWTAIGTLNKGDRVCVSGAPVTAGEYTMVPISKPMVGAVERKLIDPELSYEPATHSTIPGSYDAAAGGKQRGDRESTQMRRTLSQMSENERADAPTADAGKNAGTEVDPQTGNNISPAQPHSGAQGMSLRDIVSQHQRLAQQTLQPAGGEDPADGGGEAVWRGDGEAIQDKNVSPPRVKA